MEYVAAGYNMLTDVTFADGSQILNTPGGSWYAASGLVFWCKSVAYVGTAGPDFDEYYGKWFSDNGIDCRVKKCLPQTLKYSLKYRPDGIWTERCAQGEEYERMAKDAGRITPQMIAGACGPETKGIYIEARIAQVDAFSLNYDEACGFFGITDREEICRRLQSYGRPCFFRLGEEGSALVAPAGVTFAPAIGVEHSVDPTGCGNCSTAASLIGIAEGLPAEQTLYMANLAASYCARQTPPWPYPQEGQKHENVSGCL